MKHICYTFYWIITQVNLLYCAFLVSLKVFSSFFVLVMVDAHINYDQRFKY